MTEPGRGQGMSGYGTSMHFPYCADGRCTGCLPPPSPDLLGCRLSQTCALPLHHFGDCDEMAVEDD